jgi:hypothetical protein
MKATVQKIKEIRSIPETDAIEAVEILGRVAVVKAGIYQPDQLCILVETPNLSPNRYSPTILQVRHISEIEGPEEMKVGLSQQPWGDQLQLGPYDDALVIKEGTDVTHLILKP